MLIDKVISDYPYTWQRYAPIKFELSKAINRQDLDGFVRFMLTNDFFTLIPLAENYEEIINEYGKGVVAHTYFAVIHTDAIEDLKSISGFIDADNYECSKDKYELGSIGNLRIFSSTDEKLKDADRESYYKMLCFEPQRDCRMISVTFKKLGA